jgi:hypothetical protein
MNRDQWTVTGLIIVLAALEVIRSPNVRGFFTGFFSQFGVPASGSSGISNIGTPASTASTHTPSSQSLKGMPTAGGGRPY